MDNYCFEQGQQAKHFEQHAKKVEDKARTLQGQLCTMLDQVNSLSTLLDTLKEECTKAY